MGMGGFKVTRKPYFIHSVVKGDDGGISHGLSDIADNMLWGIRETVVSLFLKDMSIDFHMDTVEIVIVFKFYGG